jgi:hypothetical protein
LNDDDPVAVAADALAVQLTSWTFGSWTSEKVLQEAMHPRLSAVWEVWREVRLSPQDRIDFIVTLPGVTGWMPSSSRPPGEPSSPVCPAASMGSTSRSPC